MTEHLDASRSIEFERFAALARARRTSMLVDREQQVSPEVVSQLCELATWAPNHKRTWPWRFALFSGEGRALLGETMADDMEHADFGDAVKRTKTRSKYLRTPATLVVGCSPHTNEMLHAENRDAVAAGVQNLLLGATALGLATFWSTPALTQPPAVLELCGFDAGDRLIGVIYLGWALETADAPQRPPTSIKHITA